MCPIPGRLPQEKLSFVSIALASAERIIRDSWVRCHTSVIREFRGMNLGWKSYPLEIEDRPFQQWQLGTAVRLSPTSIAEVAIPVVEE